MASVLDAHGHEARSGGGPMCRSSLSSIVAEAKRAIRCYQQHLSVCPASRVLPSVASRWITSTGAATESFWNTGATRDASACASESRRLHSESQGLWLSVTVAASDRFRRRYKLGPVAVIAALGGNSRPNSRDLLASCIAAVHLLGRPSLVPSYLEIRGVANEIPRSTLHASCDSTFLLSVNEHPLYSAYLQCIYGDNAFCEFGARTDRPGGVGPCRPVKNAREL